MNGRKNFDENEFEGSIKKKKKKTFMKQKKKHLHHFY